MKILFLCKSDKLGGAAVVTFRLMEALRAEGADAKMLVSKKLSDSPFVYEAASRLRTAIPFLEERLLIFLQNGLTRKDLFKVDTASFGLPLSKHPLVKEADVICLSWVNQGMISLREIEKISAMGKRILWTMHDMWNLTGICHHAEQCSRFRSECGDCQFLHSFAGTNDLSARTLSRKEKTYDRTPITFIAVSSWLAEKAKNSTLLGCRDVRILPNAFSVEEMRKLATERPQNSDEIGIICGAARLDDPIKGLPLLKGAIAVLAKRNPGIASRLHLRTFGSVKDAHALDNLAIRHTHLGTLSTKQQIADAYCKSDIVVSSSLFETLPGTLVEGQCYGCIPVAFNRGGQSDIVTDGETGFLASFGTTDEVSVISLAIALERAVKTVLNPAERTAIRSRMLASVEAGFSARAIARSFLTIAASSPQ